MTTTIYTEVAAKVETSKVTKRRVSISGMLKYLGVSRSGYRAFKKHKPSASQQRKEAVKEEIKKIYNKSHQNYGAPKIAVELRKSGEKISERTVGKYMHEMGIRAQWVKPWITTTKDSDFSKELHNILDEQFNPVRPNAVWCTDITYIWTTDGFVYLTSIMDLYSRKIISWTLSDSMEVSCVIDTVNKAKSRRNTDLPLILHSAHLYWRQLLSDRKALIFTIIAGRSCIGTCPQIRSILNSGKAGLTGLNALPFGRMSLSAMET